MPTRNGPFIMLAMGIRLSIGDVSDRTGIPVDTLRTWERRYGFPQPERRASGHRRYSPKTVQQLRWVQTGLQFGHRISELARLERGELHGRILASAQVAASQAPTIEPLLEAILRYGTDAFDGELERQWQLLGALGFLHHVAVPLMRDVGERWSRGELSVGQEHFASEVLHEFLAGKWRVLNRELTGAPCILTTLPGERHTLGLHMAAVLAVLERTPVLYLGAETPIGELVDTLGQTDAWGVVVGTSASANHETLRHQIASLLEALELTEGAVEVIVGGPQVELVGDFGEGVTLLSDLSHFQAWLRYVAPRGLTPVQLDHH